MPKHQLSPEEQEAAAEALLKKYQDGTLEDGETELDDLDDIGEIGSLAEAQAGDPAKSSTKKDEEGDDATTKPSQSDDDGGDQGGKGEEADGTKVSDDEGNVQATGEGPEGDGEKPGGDTGDAGGSTEGLDDNSAKRVKDSQRKMHEATGKAARLGRENDEIKARLAALEAGEVVAPAKVAPVVQARKFEGMSAEELKELGEEFPSMAKLANVVGGLQDENDALRSELARVEGDVTTTRTNTSRSNWLNAIKEVHPDVEKIQVSDTFEGWLTEQPDYVQHAVYESGTVRDMIKIITDYKDDIGQEAASEEEVVADADKKKKSKLEQAKEIDTPNLRTPARQHKPGGGNAPTMSQTEINKFRNEMHNMTPEEIAAFEKRMDAAVAAGRVSPN